MAYCDEYWQLISAGLDGALSPDEEETLSAHLAQCPECKALYEELSVLHAALSDLPPVEVPADLHGRIMKAVAAEQVLPFVPLEKKKSSVHWQRWLASAAVFAVVLAGAYRWKPWEHPMGDVAPQAAEVQRNADTSISTKALPEPTTPEAVPEMAALGAESSDAPVEPVLSPQPPTAEGAAKAKPSGGGGADKMSIDDMDSENLEDATETGAAISPRMARMGAENGEAPLEPDPAAEIEGGNAVSQMPALFSALPPQPTEAPEETEAPTAQSFMVTSMSTPNETAEPVGVTAREALERLVTYIFEYSGYDSVEYISEEEGLYAQVTAQGCGGSIYFLPEEDDETLYWFEFHPEIGDDVYYYTVCRLTGEPTSLLGE